MKRRSTIKALIFDEEVLMREFLEELLSRKGHGVHQVDRPADVVAALHSERFDVVFMSASGGKGDRLDLLRRIREIDSAIGVVVTTAVARLEDAVEAMRLGACDYLTKPVTAESIDEVLGRISGGPVEPASGLSDKSKERLLIGESPPMQELDSLIRLAASTDATVLVSGETGTGKELIARAIHVRSTRRHEPFVRLNCAALPEALYESELFGHDRGAFTGAIQQRKGRFELAHRGTLLMDEISEVGLGVQAKLLRVLQEKEFERVGGTKTIQVDTRVIATTNRDLACEIREGRFRSDLYYRLSVFPIAVPPLRERRDDIPMLAEHFIRLQSGRRGQAPKVIAPSAMEIMQSHDWPGNVRQLENCLERADLIASGSMIGPEHLGAIAGPELVRPLAPIPQERYVAPSLRDMETDLLLRTLDEFQGNRTEAARRLGITTRTLRNKLHRIGMMDYLKPDGRQRKDLPGDGKEESHSRNQTPVSITDTNLPSLCSDKGIGIPESNGPEFAGTSGQGENRRISEGRH